LNLVVHQQIPDHPDLRTAWQKLLRQVDQPQIFYTHEWALSIARAYSATISPLLFIAYDRGELVGLAALSADYVHGQASFLAATTADYCDFLCIEEHRRQFVDLVLERIDAMGLPTLVLANLPADSATARTLRSLSGSRGFSILIRPAYHCAQVSLRSAGDRESIRNAVNQKHIVRRHLKALAKVGAVNVEHLTNSAEIAKALPEFSTAHVARFLSTGRISNLASLERRTFLEELTERCSEQGGVVLSRLTLDGRPIAWNFGFRYSSSWFWYQPTFDGDFQQYSPGLCLLAKILEHAAQDHNLQIVDLGLGAEGYKDRWSRQGRETLHVTASRSSAAYCREALRYHVTRAIEQVPAADRSVRFLAKNFSRLRRQHRTLPNLARFIANRCSTWIFERPEVLFFEKPHSNPVPQRELRILPAAINLFARAAMEYRHDPETLAYLLRATPRMRSGQCQGFVTVDSHGMPVHFCWVTPFAKFYVSELKSEMTAPCPNAILIFDCWTPVSKRGNGYYSDTIARIADDSLYANSRAWIFAAATLQASLRGIRRAGFAERFSVMVRRSGLKTRKMIYSDSPGVIAQASSAA